MCASKPAEHQGSLSQNFTIDELEERFKNLNAQSNVSSFEQVGFWLEPLETAAKNLHDQTLSSRCAQLRKQILARSRALNPSKCFSADRVRAKAKKPKKRRKTIVVDSQQNQVSGPSDTTRIATQVLGKKDQNSALPNASVLDEADHTISSNSVTRTSAEQTPGTTSTTLARALPFLRRNEMEKLEGRVNEDLNLLPSKIRSNNLQKDFADVNQAIENEQQTLTDILNSKVALDKAPVQEKITRYKRLQVTITKAIEEPQHDLPLLIIPEVSPKFDHKTFTTIEAATSSSSTLPKTPPNSPTAALCQASPAVEAAANSADGLKRMGVFPRLNKWIKDHKSSVFLILLAAGGTVLTFHQPLAKRLASTRLFQLFKKIASFVYAQKAAGPIRA